MTGGSGGETPAPGGIQARCAAEKKMCGCDQVARGSGAAPAH